MDSIETPGWYTGLEQLREKLLLTKGSMAKVLGVTRVAYYDWSTGAEPRAKVMTRIHGRVDSIIDVLGEGWPTPRAKGLEQKERLEHLLDLLNQIN